MKIKVLFDANPLVNGPMSGVGYYTQGLIRSLAETFPEDLELVGHYFNFFGRKANLDTLPQAPNISYLESKLLPGKVISICRRLGFQPPIELFVRKKFDVILYPNFVGLPSIYKAPSAVVIHDLCYHDMPEFVHEKNRSFLARFVPKSIKHSALIICVSEFTKNRVQEIYDTADKEIIVTHNPPMSPTPGNKDTLKTLGIEKKYLLYIGTLEPRKNIRGLADAYTKLPRSTRNEYSLVLAGGKGWYIEDDIDYITGLRSQGYDILLTGYVSGNQRAALYANADLFVLASCYEGFGMPILEAMTYSCPCALSDIEVFHEVAGDSAEYFNPEDLNSIATALVDVLEDETKKKALKAAGQKRLELYNWEAVARKVQESISRLARE